MQDQNLLNRHPGFANLVADLNTRFLTPTGTSLHLDQELHQARYALNHKRSYLESKTLFEPIDRLRFLPLDNYNNLSSTDPNNVVGSNQAAAAADFQRDISTHLDRLLSILETRRLIITSTDTPTQSIGRSSRSSDNNSGRSSVGESGTEAGSAALAPPPSIIEILASRNKTQSHDAHVDLDEFVVDQLRPHLDALEGISPYLINAIQQSVHQRQQDLLSLYNTISSEHNAATGTTNSLEDLIAHTKKQAIFLDRCKEDAVLLDITLQDKAHTLFETLNQSVAMLWEIIVQFKIRYQLEQDQTFREYFSQLVESLRLKLEILKVMVQEHIYNHDTVTKLAIIRDEIDKRQESLTHQRDQNTLLLDRYKTAGPEFNTIVQTYTDIMHRIDIVQDDIRRLQ
ncbi:MAG: HAUS augmin-like complex subunit 4-domain-containing protein [Linnemannia gamsii]|nr:MAG: HAUS augmin-like complex subunit 4-domain-containing protein [Linnemannia gamsii]